MRTMVYLYSECIEIVQGEFKRKKLNIKNQYKHTIEPGTIINGVITNKAAVVRALNAAQNEIDFHKTTLVINSSLIANKKVDVPKLRPKELKAIAKAEFENANNAEDLIIDYMGILGKNDVTSMFCIAAEKEMLMSYIEVFKAANIKLAKIETAVSTTLNYVEAANVFNDQTFALNIVVGNIVLYFLFEEGRYKFSSQVRLINDRESEGLASELSSKLSSLVQFSKSQRLETSLDQAYYIGLSDTEMQHLQAFSSGMGIAILEMPQNEAIQMESAVDAAVDLNQFFYPTAAFFDTKNGVDLYDSYYEKKEGHSQKGYNKWLIPPITLIAIGLILSVTFGVMNAKKQSELDALNAEIESTEMVTEYAEAQTIEAELTALTSYYNELQNGQDYANGYPDINSDKITTLETLGSGITLSSISYESSSGTMSVSAKAASVFDAAIYVGQLLKSGLFQDISYTGYAISEGSTETNTETATAEDGSTYESTTTTTTPDTYGFSIECVLKPGVVS